MGRVCKEKEGLDLIVANLRPEFRKAFQGTLAEELRTRNSDGSLPFILQISNIATTFESWAEEHGLEVPRDPKTTAKEKSTKNALLHKIMAHDTANYTEDDIAMAKMSNDDESEVYIKAMTTSCKVCSGNHETTECYRLLNYMIIKRYAENNPDTVKILVRGKLYVGSLEENLLPGTEK